jgi:uncharacterized protein YraI
MRYSIVLAVLTVLLMTPQAARADHDGIILTKAHLRAGPSTNYPRLYTVRANARVNIIGCISGWGWCDVSVEGARGWISSGALGVRYRGHTRGVPTYARRIGVPVIVFNERVYWSKYYYDRDFYRQRYGRHHDHRWSERDCRDRDHDGDRDCRAYDRHHDDHGRNWDDDDRDDDHDWRRRDDNDNDWDHNHYNN